TNGRASVAAADARRERDVGRGRRPRRGGPASGDPRTDVAPGLRLPCGRSVVLSRHRELGPAGDLPPAVGTALRALEMVVDVADRVEVARAAVRAALDGAVRREDPGDRTGQVLAEEPRAPPRVEMVPRKDLVERTAPEIEGRIEAVRGHRVEPDIDPAVLRPAVEARAAALRRLDDVGESAVAGVQHPWEGGEPGVVTADFDPRPAELAGEERLPHACLLEV